MEMQPVAEVSNQGKKLILKILKNPQVENSVSKDSNQGEDVALKKSTIGCRK